MQGGIPPCITDSHPHRVANTKYRIDTIISPDDGHRVARNMWRKEIDILKKLCTKLALFTRLFLKYLLIHFFERKCQVVYSAFPKACGIHFTVFDL